MPKSFKSNIKGADKLFSANDTDISDISSIQDISSTSNTQNISDIPSIQKTEKKKEFYHFLLKMSIELKEFVTEASWRNRMTVTDYLNSLIIADKNKFENH
jgi:hypothetical protein